MEEIQMFWDRSQLIVPTGLAREQRRLLVPRAPLAILSFKKPHQQPRTPSIVLSRILFSSCWHEGNHSTLYSCGSSPPLPARDDDDHQESLISGFLKGEEVVGAQEKRS